MEMEEVYYILNGRKFTSLTNVITYYNANIRNGVPCVASIVYCGVEIGTINVDRLDAEISRNIK